MKVISYNILSNRWAIYNPDNPATAKLKNRYEFVANDLLLWENRLPKIINKIAGYDIICLQEVDLENIDDIINRLPDYDYHHVIWKDEYKGKDIYKRTNPIGNINLWKKHIQCIGKKANSCSIITQFTDFTLVNVQRWKKF